MMNRQAVALGKVLGIPVALDYSWFLIFALMTWTLAAGYYPAAFPGWATGAYWLLGAVTAGMLFASVLLHELGHSVVARRFGIRVRSITLFIFGGIARIDAEPPTPRADLLVAVAGPAVSLALALLFGLLRPVVASVTPVLALVRYLGYINWGLALFNLVPGFPLDGGRVLRALIWGAHRTHARATVIAATAGRVVALLFILGGVFEIFGGNVTNGLWIAFIGWFLEHAAAGQLRQQTALDLLGGHTVAEAMSTHYGIVQAETPVRQMVDQYVLAGGQRGFVVVRGGRIVGFATLREIKAVPQERWSDVRADQMMSPTSRMHPLRPDAPLTEAAADLERDGLNQLPVVVDRRVVGMLSRDDVISYLRTLQEFAGAAR